jgi:hypothetical protein
MACEKCGGGAAFETPARDAAVPPWRSAFPGRLETKSCFQNFLACGGCGARCGTNGRMPVGLAPSSISRIAAAVLAALWAMTGLTNDYVALSSVGLSARTVLDFAADVMLAGGASLAFVNAGGWIRALLVTLFVSTVVRIAVAAATPAPTAQIVGSSVAFLAIAALTVTAIDRGRSKGSP